MKKYHLIAAGVLLTVLVGFTVYYFNMPICKGEFVRNPDSYAARIEKMNGTDLHVMELKEGDVLYIHFETVKGEMYLKIIGPDGLSIYEGNGKGISDFEVNILKEGTYSLSLAAKRAKGYLNIHL